MLRLLDLVKPVTLLVTLGLIALFGCATLSGSAMINVKGTQVSITAAQQQVCVSDTSNWVALGSSLCVNTVCASGGAGTPAWASVVFAAPAPGGCKAGITGAPFTFIVP